MAMTEELLVKARALLDALAFVIDDEDAVSLALSTWCDPGDAFNQVNPETGLPWVEPNEQPAGTNALTKALLELEEVSRWRRPE